MKTNATHLITLLAVLGFAAGCAAMAEPQGAKTADAKPSGHEQNLVERRAVVTAVDQRQRLLAITGDDGDKAVLAIPGEFHDLDKLRVGDPVVVSYTEAIAWQVKPAGKAASGVSVREALTNPMPGEEPGGAIQRDVTVTATIAGIDRANATATLAGPQGNLQTVKVQNPADLERVAVGDLVEITFSEVRALSVRRADKR